MNFSTLNLNWQQTDLIRHKLPKNVKDWLLHRESFVSRLKEQGASNPFITVLFQGWQLPTSQEKDFLQLPDRKFIYAREVLIQSPRKKWMIARTLFPQELLQGKWRIFMRLKNKTLGSILFKNKFIRSSLDIAEINETSWGRRSIFLRKKQFLLLTEIFMPDVFTL